MSDTGSTDVIDEAKSDPPEAEKALFRAQAIAHKRRALYGEVILKSSLSSWVITSLLAVICVAAAALAFSGTVQADGNTVPLWQWLSGRS